MASMHSHLVPGVDPQACVQDTIGYRGAELVRVTLIYGLLSCELKLESVSGIERSKKSQCAGLSAQKITVPERTHAVQNLICASLGCIRTTQ